MSVSHPYTLLTMTVLSGAQLWCGRVGLQATTDQYTVQNDTLPTARYVDEILDVYVRPYIGAKDPNFILVDDNACPHWALVTNEYLQTATLERIDWPARFPDLNPIEHAMEMLKTPYLSAQSSQPRFKSYKRHYWTSGLESRNNAFEVLLTI